MTEKEVAVIKWIDEKSWKRKPLLDKYSSYVFPYINIGADMDVTNLYYFSKKNNLSFYCAMIHAATKTALEIENFKYRIIDGKPAICDSLTPVFTYLPKGEEQFYLVEQPYEEDIAAFCRKAKAKAEAMADDTEHLYMHGKDEVEILYMTCIPWIRYTHFVRTIEDSKKDNIPRISWGKYEKDKDGKVTMPFSVQVHHATMDGYHVGLYFEKLESYLRSVGQ